MHLSDFAHAGRRALAFAVIAGGVGIFVPAPAEAEILSCDRATIGPQVQDAMLALKATQYCVGTSFPFTERDVLARLDELRCDDGASQMIDELYDAFDKQYRMILTKDKTHMVCNHAATLAIK